MNILITGTSSGIGFGLAKYYLDQNHFVYGISRETNEILNDYNNFQFLGQDISAFEETEAKLSEFLARIKVLDLVILNAGILSHVKDLKDTNLHEIQKIMNINVWANKILIDTLFKNINKISQVVAISSMASHGNSRGWNAYSLSKATLNILIRLYALEFTTTHFSSLAPGPVDTKIQDYIYNITDDEKYPSVRKLKRKKRLLQMQNVGEASQSLSLAIQNANNFKSGNFFNVKKLIISQNLFWDKNSIKYYINRFIGKWYLKLIFFLSHQMPYYDIPFFG